MSNSLNSVRTRHAWIHARTRSIGFFAACIQFQGDTVPIAQLASKTAHSFPGIGFFDAWYISLCTCHTLPLVRAYTGQVQEAHGAKATRFCCPAGWRIATLVLRDELPRRRRGLMSAEAASRQALAWLQIGRVCQGQGKQTSSPPLSQSAITDLLLDAFNWILRPVRL
jgi:hypothetical protein